ncbi:AtpZ/AtpI family protein [Candidatus Uhrbacteria bacterium]|nr:AtpZ/AtpI family protein [Candidatus Uhrbacteria bacterium]
MEIKQKEKNQVWSALALAWQLGYTIAVPIVVLGLLGRILDKRFGTSPLFLLLGILISIIISSIGIYKKTKKILDSNF